MINNYKLFSEIGHVGAQTAAQNNPLLLGHWGREDACGSMGQAHNFWTVLHVRAVKLLPNQQQKRERRKVQRSRAWKTDNELSYMTINFFEVDLVCWYGQWQTGFKSFMTCVISCTLQKTEFN